MPSRPYIAKPGPIVVAPKKDKKKKKTEKSS